MKADELQALKARVAGAFYESPGGDLDGMLKDMTRFISRSGLFLPPAVRMTGSRSHQVEARCVPASPQTPVARLSDEVERIWMDDLRYDDFEAHALLVTEKSIVLDFLTVARSARLYVTGMIIVGLARPA